MIYLLIWADSRLQQVEQLTDEILAAYAAGRVEIIQAPVASGSVLTELVDLDGDVLEWSAISKGGANG